MNPLHRIVFLFIVLSLIPLLWYNKVEFDLAKFTTEYYKYLFNVFIWSGIISIYFKSEIEEYFKNRKLNSLNLQITTGIKDLKTSDSKEYSYIVKSKKIYNFLLSKEKVVIDLDKTDNLLKKHLTFLNSVSELNYKSKQDTADFKNAITYIKSL